MQNRLHLALFFDGASRLGDREWSWTDVRSQQCALSGTDSSLLELAHDLYVRSYEVTVFTTRGCSDNSGGPTTLVVSTPDEAVVMARQRGANVFMFMYDGADSMQELVSSCVRHEQPCVIWMQSPLEESSMDLAASSEIVRRVVAVSHVQADWFRDHPLFSKVAVIHNGIPTDEYLSGGDFSPYAICFVGATTATKGFHHLAHVWPRVKQAIPESTLTVFGSARLHDPRVECGPLGLSSPDFEQEELIPFIGDTPAEAYRRGVVIRGLQPRSELRSGLHRFALGVVNPSATGGVELFCVSAVELQACGVPVVGGRAGALFETVNNGITGVLVRSEAELERTIVSLLRNPRHLKSMRDEAPDWIRERFERRWLLHAWEHLLYDIVHESSPQPPAFLWRQAGKKAWIHAAFRIGRNLPVIGRHIPTAHRAKRAISAMFVRHGNV